MALTVEEKATVDKVVAKLEELNQVILESRPLQSTGASHIFNQVLPLVEDLKAIPVEEPEE